MRMDKLTHPLQNALADAQSLALGRDHSQIDSAHLLQALVNQQGGSVRPLLQRAGANLDALQQSLRKLIDALPVLSNATGEVQVSPVLSKVLNLSDRKAQQGGDHFISSELVLQALFEAGGGVAQALKSSGVTAPGLDAAVRAVRGGEAVASADAEEQRQALERYTIDLTERARDGKLDPVIGRDDEIRRTVQVLQRRTKNNPVLIGEPGVGKPPSSRASPSA